MNKLVPKFLVGGSTELKLNKRLNAFDAYGNPNGLRNPLLSAPPETSAPKLPATSTPAPLNFGNTGIASAPVKLPPVKAPEVAIPQATIDPNAINKNIGNIASGIGKNASAEGKAGAISAGVDLTAIAGKYLINKNIKSTDSANKKGNALWASTVVDRTSQGATLGSVAGPYGTIIGAAVGAIEGTVEGGIKKKKMVAADRKAQAIAKAQTLKNNADFKKASIQYQDMMTSNAVMSAKKGGLLKYKKGNELVGKPVAKAPTKKLKDTPIFALGGSLKIRSLQDLSEDEIKMFSEKLQKVKDQEGFLALTQEFSLDPEEVTQVLQTQQEQSSQPIYKKGGKMKLKAKKCACEHKPKPMMFRRGGSLDLEKSNVIVDGPSHGEFNNTGVKGDKGLPIVKNGHKIAEIESGELIINKESSDKIQQLRKEAAKGNEKAKEDLGKLLHEELAKNTYDYTTLLD